MSKVISMFFNILYAIALMTCFIVNLAVSNTLSWFFIVFAALLIPFTLTSLFIFIKKYKFLIISLSFFGSILLLLGVINMYTNGDWFFVASAAIIFGYLVMFTPLLLIHYEVTKVIKSHGAILCFLVDLVGLLLLLLVINIYNQGDWLFTIAYPITFFCSTLPLLFIVIIRYLKINWSFKVSLCFITTGLYTLTINIFIASILNSELNHQYDLMNWSTDEYISGNINLINFISLVFVALLFGLMGIFVKKNKPVTDN